MSRLPKSGYERRPTCRHSLGNDRHCFKDPVRQFRVAPEFRPAERCLLGDAFCEKPPGNLFAELDLSLQVRGLALKEPPSRLLSYDIRFGAAATALFYVGLRRYESGSAINANVRARPARRP